jgi:hypothetical protein
MQVTDGLNLVVTMKLFTVMVLKIPGDFCLVIVSVPLM